MKVRRFLWVLSLILVLPRGIQASAPLWMVEMGWESAWLKDSISLSVSRGEAQCEFPLGNGVSVDVHAWGASCRASNADLRGSSNWGLSGSISLSGGHLKPWTVSLAACVPAEGALDRSSPEARLIRIASSGALNLSGAALARTPAASISASAGLLTGRTTSIAGVCGLSFRAASRLEGMDVRAPFEATGGAVLESSLGSGGFLTAAVDFSIDSPCEIEDYEATGWQRSGAVRVGYERRTPRTVLEVRATLAAASVRLSDSESGRPDASSWSKWAGCVLRASRASEGHFLRGAGVRIEYSTGDSGDLPLPDGWFVAAGPSLELDLLHYVVRVAALVSTGQLHNVFGSSSTFGTTGFGVRLHLVPCQGGLP